MPIKFFNIRSKETRVAETEPMISAMWASSDRSPNITQGQDFGWRLAPSVVVELKQIKQDMSLLMQLAARYNVLLEDVDEKLILQFISDKTALENAPVAQTQDYTDEYDAEIRRLELAALKEKAKASEPSSVPTAPPAYPKVEGGIRYFLDGNKVAAAHDATFLNMRESPVGFGDTDELALEDFRRESAKTTTTTTTAVK